MRTEIFIIFLLVAIFHFAQSQNKKTGIWSERQYKNELSLDISPAIRWAVAPNEDPESVGLTYRKFFNSKHAFRIGYRSYFEVNTYYDTDNIGLSYRFVTPDSIRLNFSLPLESRRWQLHVLKTGYEYRLGNRRVKGIFGIDIINGIHRKSVSSSRDTYYSETMFADTSGTGWLLAVDTVQYNIGISYHHTSYAIGFTPTIGLNINLSKR